MSFTRALYYPTIGIPNEGWLKNAMLYWDKIYTIFPTTYISQPSQFYQTRTEREFSEARLLLPLEVHPFMPEIEGLSEDILKYLDTPEGKEVLREQRNSKPYTIHGQKPQRDTANQMIFQIHQDKLPYQITDLLRHNSSGDWISVDKRFADFYMTLLATRLAGRNEAGLLTYALIFDNLANAAKVDAPRPSGRDEDEISKISIKLNRQYGYKYHRVEPPTLAQGMLAKLVIEQIEIDPNTPVKKILDFRKEYEDEIGNFRVKIAELTSSISEDLPPDQLRQKVEDIYINEVKPAIRDLKKGLKNSLISWGTKNTLTIGGVSTSSVALLSLLHLATPFTLIADAGILVTLSAIQFNRERADKLRQNRYSFVLGAQRTFRRKSIWRIRP